MPIQPFIDWIAATIPKPGYGFEEAREWGAALTYTEPKDWVPGKPTHGYRWAADHPLGFKCMCGRVDMGTHLIMPGNALQEGQNGRNMVWLMLGALNASKAKLTRLDLALDAVEEGLDIQSLAADYEQRRFVGTARLWHYETSDRGGQTLYIGARTSDYYLRIYNKYAELAKNAKKPDVEDWRRIELETKGMAARAINHDIMCGRPMLDVVCGNITAVCDFAEDIPWRRIMGAVTAQLAPSHRKLRHTERWLLGVVASSLARQIHLQPDFKRQFELAVQGALLDIEKHDLDL